MNHRRKQFFFKLACGRCGHDKTNTERIEGIGDGHVNIHMNFKTSFVYIRAVKD